MGNTDEGYINVLKVVSEKYPNSKIGFNDKKFTSKSSQIYQNQLNVLTKLTINLNKKVKNLGQKSDSLDSINSTITPPQSKEI